MSRRSPKRVAFDLLSVARLRRSGAAFPPVASVAGRADRRLFIGPANSAGQGTAWARAVEHADSGVSATSMAFTRERRFAFDVDVAVPSAYGAHSRAWQRRQFAAVSQFDAAIVESGLAPFATLDGGDPLRQLRALESAGVRTALLFHGSDIRDPDAHLAAEPESPFAVDPALAERLRATTRRNRALVERARRPVFVSTPDLLDELDDAGWLPVVVDPERWRAAAAPADHDGPLRVVHIPSSSSLKGTDLIEPVLRRLADAGEIEYAPILGVPHAEMPAAYGRADIVIDQLRVGIYGVAACEALAAGRIVVSYVADRVRETTTRLTGDDLPIVQATGATLEGVLKDIVDRRDRYRALAASGPQFVRAHHDGRRSGRVLAGWLAGDAAAEAEGALR